MADSRENVPMSVIPYDMQREVVLRHNDAVVLFDPESRQLVLRSTDDEGDIARNNCPYCHRPLHDEANIREPPGRTSSPGVQAGFVNPQYFRMLRQSLQRSTNSPAPPSPQRRLAQPIRRPINDNAHPPQPPPGAEFLGSTPAAPDEDQGIAASSFSPNFLQKVFLVERELGRGGRGVVLLVKHVLDGVDCGSFACKRIPVGDDHKWLEKVLIEVQLLQRLHHQNLVSYHHVWLEDTKINTFGPKVPCAFILQQYCNGGDLQSYIVGNAQTTTNTEQLKERIRRRSKGDLEPPNLLNSLRTLSFDEIYSFFKDISAGIQFLHSNGFIHRDLKPSNCLLHDTGQEIRVLVSDFGEVQEQNAVRKSSGATGTLSYCAPEVLQRVRPGGPYGNFSLKSDMFSLGMILYFMCFASLPYNNADVLHEESEDLDSLRAEVCAWSGFNDERRQRPDLPKELYVFLKRLLAVRPEDRPSADEVCHGIRTGTGLGSQGPPRTPPPAFEELTPGRRRIVSVDSPGSSSPVRGPLNQVRTSASSTAVVKPRPSRLRHQTSYQGRDASNRSPLLGHDQEHSRSPDSDLILRRPRSPSTQRHSLSPTGLPDEQEWVLRSQYLLTAGDSHQHQTRALKLWTLVDSIWTRRWMSFILVCVKVITLLQPCSSRGINPMTVYPLLLLALWDFGQGGAHYGLSLAAFVLHCAALGVSRHSDNLCAAAHWRVDEE